MTFADDFDDPFEALVACFHAFGFDDEAILSVDAEPFADDLDSPLEFVKRHYQVVLGFPDREPDPEKVRPHLTQLAHTLFPASFELDWKWHAHRVASQANFGLERHGYETDVAFVTSTADSAYPSLETTHPETFELLLRAADSDSTIERVPFRLPPASTESKAVLNHVATAEAINRTLLDGHGLEIVQRIGVTGDRTDFAVVESHRLDELEAEYGPQFDLFGDPLLRRDLLAESLTDYDADCTRDHDEEFDVPEPSDTFKLEEVPEATTAIADGQSEGGDDSPASADSGRR